MRAFWSDVQPHLIDREMAQDYAKRRNMAAATIRYELGMLSVALRWAVDKEIIKKAPTIWRPDPPERRVRHLTRSEFERWFKEVKAPHARLYVELGLATMARPSAILELTWNRVDFDRGTVDLNPSGRRQTRKRRPVVPLNDDALNALREAYTGRQSHFVIERGAQQVKSIKKAFQAASGRADADDRCCGVGRADDRCGVGRIQPAACLLGAADDLSGKSPKKHFNFKFASLSS